MKLTGEEFLGRFLQHVLPDRFRRVRHYGIFCPGKSDVLEKVREELVQAAEAVAATLLKNEASSTQEQEKDKDKKAEEEQAQGPLCPDCGKPMRRGREIAPVHIDGS